VSRLTVKAITTSRFPPIPGGAAKGKRTDMSDMTIKVEKGNMVITVPLGKPVASKSGKSLVLFSTHGNVATSAIVQGKPVIMGLNLYIRA
jgi:hypothetical protein